MKITKEMIEEEVGFEITKFKLEPRYENGECVGLNVKVEPKIRMGFISMTVTIGNKETFKNLDMTDDICNHIWKHGYSLEPVVFCAKCDKDADVVYPGMPYTEQVRLVV